MIFTIANQKGGVGKTTTTVNLGTYLAESGKKVLLIDIDPQSNLTSGLGFRTRSHELKNTKDSYKSVYDVLIGDSKISEVFSTTEIKNLHLLPSNINLAGAEIELVNKISREGLLKKSIKELHELYDYILIDAPPSLGILTINALTASDYVLIPLQCEYYALEGIKQLLDVINLVKTSLNPNLKLGGVVLTMFDARTRLSNEVMEEARSFFKDKVFDTIVPRNVRLSEAPSFGKPISRYDPACQGAIAYKNLVKEFLKKTW